MISDEIILKAAQAAGLHVRASATRGLEINRSGGNFWAVFRPTYHNDDNAMIMDGAKINVNYGGSVSASWGNITIFVSDSSGNTPQARRDAIILCAAEKFDATNVEEK